MPEFADAEGGAVVNVTIDRFVRGTLVDGEVTFQHDVRAAGLGSSACELVLAEALRNPEADLDDIAADWRAWADAYRLPMLLVEADGVARTLEESLGAVRKAEPKARRRRPTSMPRRPRFLARRRAGNLGLRLVIGGEEIVARE